MAASSELPLRRAARVLAEQAFDLARLVAKRVEPGLDGPDGFEGHAFLHEKAHRVCGAGIVLQDRRKRLPDHSRKLSFMYIQSSPLQPIVARTAETKAATVAGGYSR